MRNRLAVACFLILSAVIGNTYGSLALESNESSTRNSQIARRFSCSIDEMTGYYQTTIAIGNHRPQPIIFWSPITFNPESDLKSRCHEAAQNLQKLSNLKRLSFLGAGFINDKPVICSVISQNSNSCSEAVFEIDYQFLYRNSVVRPRRITESSQLVGYAKYFLNVIQSGFSNNILTNSNQEDIETADDWHYQNFLLSYSSRLLAQNSNRLLILNELPKVASLGSFEGGGHDSENISLTERAWIQINSAFSQGDYETAQKLLNVVLNNTTDITDTIRANVYMGRLFIRQNKPSEASFYYYEALEQIQSRHQNPAKSQANLYYDWSQELYRQGKSDKSLMEHAIEKYQSLVPSERDYQSYTRLGLMLSRLNRLDEAIFNYKKAAIAIPERSRSDFYIASLEAKIRNNLGVALEQKRRFSEALDEYRQALILDPSLSTARNNFIILERRTSLERLDYDSQNSVTQSNNSPPNRAQVSELIPPVEQNPRVQYFRATVMIEKRSTQDGPSQNSDPASTGWVAHRKDDELFIVTCRHNLTNRLGQVNGIFKVSFYSDLSPGRSYLSLPAELLHDDSELDVAVIKVTNAPADIRPLEIASVDQIQSTGRVWVLGHPSILEDPWQLTDGNRTNYSLRRNLFSITAPIASGSSGSPVFDEETNQVIGMVTAVVDQNNFSPNRERPTPSIANVVVLGYSPQFGQAIRITPIQEALERWQILPRPQQSK